MPWPGAPLCIPLGQFYLFAGGGGWRGGGTGAPRPCLGAPDLLEQRNNGLEKYEQCKMTHFSQISGTGYGNACDIHGRNCSIFGCKNPPRCVHAYDVQYIPFADSLVLRDYAPPQPLVNKRLGGAILIYAGRVVGVIKSCWLGKTWLGEC